MVTGDAELMANIRALREKGRNAQERALNEMATTFSEILQSNVPVGMQHGSEMHLADDTKIAKPRRRQGELSVRVGFAGSASSGPLPAWYAHFVDTGSIKVAPSFFSRNSRDQATPELKETIIDVFQREIGS